MAAFKLTATKVERHRPVKADETLTDGNGLYLRFRRGQAGGLSRMWMYTYKVGTRSSYVTLGEHNGSLSDFDIELYHLPSGTRLTLETARRIAAELTDWRKRGIDPKGFRQSEEARQEETQAALAQQIAADEAKQAEERKNVQDLFDSWIADGVRRKDGNAELKRQFEASVLPRIGSIPVKDLTEHDLRAVLRALVERGVNRSAVIARNNLTQMFAWGRKRQPWRKLLVEGDPMELIEIEKIVAPDYDMATFRDRVLSDAEITELHDILLRRQAEYDAAPNKRVVPQPLEPMTQCAIWIMLSTLTRVGETSMARWEHVNLEAGEWFIPKANVKGNFSDLTIYFSAFTLEQFKRLDTLTGHTAWCFPSRNEDSHIDVKSFTKQIGDRQSMFRRNKDGTPRAPLKNRVHDNTLMLAGGATGPWTSHDLRRTGATIMQRLGVTLEVIDRCQNHVLGGSKVRRHYLHHDYANEKREAWSLLGKYLSTLIHIKVPKTSSY
ncbi:MAG: tyrosine-type recombinase/integrase [Pseudomonadota bacterium]